MCAGALLAATGAMRAAGVDRPAARRRCVELLNVYLHRGFTDGGECDEGVAYWRFGLANAVDGWSRLTPDELAAVDLDRLRKVADYPRRAYLSGDDFYAANDSDGRFPGTYSYGMLPWLAAATGDKWLAGLAARVGPVPSLGNLAQALTQIAVIDAGGFDAPPDLVAQTPPTAWLADQQAVIWRRGRWLFTFAGGHNKERHNHNDLGHVNAWLDSGPILVDLGKPRYAADFFGPKRYDYLAAGSGGHNVPLVNGHAQRPGRDAQAVVLDRGDDAATLGLTAAYPPEAGLVSWTRTAVASAGGMTITDDVSLAADGEAVFRFWTAQPVRLPDADLAAIGPASLAFDGGEFGETLTVSAGDLRLASHDSGTVLACVQRRLPVGPGGARLVTTLRPADFRAHERAWES